MPEVGPGSLTSGDRWSDMIPACRRGCRTKDIELLVLRARDRHPSAHPPTTPGLGGPLPSCGGCPEHCGPIAWWPVAASCAGITEAQGAFHDAVFESASDDVVSALRRRPSPSQDTVMGVGDAGRRGRGGANRAVHRDGAGPPRPPGHGRRPRSGAGAGRVVVASRRDAVPPPARLPRAGGGGAAGRAAARLARPARRGGRAHHGSGRVRRVRS